MFIQIQPFQGCQTRRCLPRIALTFVRPASGAIRIQLLRSCQACILIINALALYVQENKVDANVAPKVAAWQPPTAVEYE